MKDNFVFRAGLVEPEYLDFSIRATRGPEKNKIILKLNNNKLLIIIHTAVHQSDLDSLPDWQDNTRR